MIKLALLGGAAAVLLASAYGIHEMNEAPLECERPRHQADTKPSKTATVKTIQVDEVEKLLSGKAPKPFVFDANPIEVYREGHVPGAKWIDFSHVTADALPADKDAMLIFYCYNEMCGASPAAAKAALGLGWRNVYLMGAGISGWKKANKAVEQG
jgi:rhodanese-related sulfurtransferase